MDLRFRSVFRNFDNLGASVYKRFCAFFSLVYYSSKLMLDTRSSSTPDFGCDGGQNLLQRYYVSYAMPASFT